MRKALALATVLLLAGCSVGKHKEEPAPQPSPDLTASPAAVAVNPGPFQAGPVRAPRTGALIAPWIKPDELTPVGRLAAVDGLEENLGRPLSIVNTYRRFEQMVGTPSDKELLSQGATLMVSWA